MILVSELNKKITERRGWITDEREDVAVLFINKELQVTGTKVGKGYVIINFGRWDLYGCYISPNINMDEYKGKVDEIAKYVRSGKKEAVVAGDINAKSHLWESPISDRKGDHWAEWIAALDLVVHNTGGAPTFVRGTTESYIDVTISTQKISTRFTNWELIEEENLTEYRLIYYEIKVDKAPKKVSGKHKVMTDWNASRYWGGLAWENEDALLSYLVLSCHPLMQPVILL